MTLTPLAAHLFGGLELQDDQGNRVSFRHTKTGLLLAYLALRAPQSHLRESVADALWSEGDSAAVRNRLRQEISALRRALKEAGIDGTRCIEATANTLKLHSNVETDVQRYRQALSLAERAGDKREKRQALEQAAALYSAPLLTDFDAFWIVTEREELANAHARAMRELAALQQEAGEYALAEKTLHQLLRLDPLQEEAHTDLMQLYACAGQPTQVLRQYQELERVLREAFDMEPPDATRRWMETLRQQAAEAASQASGVALDSPLSPERAVAPFAPTAESAPPLETLETDAYEREMVASLPDYALTPYDLEAALLETPNAKPRRAARRRIRVALAFALLSCFGLFSWNRWGRSETPRLAWVAEYHAQAGEKENSEPRAAVTDEAGNLYVCGLTQTEREDVDILLLKYSPDGELLWRNRYSSPEHDCDRAFDLAFDRGSVYVVGETYVPDRPGVPGGWKTVTVKYDAANGAEQWARRAPVFAKNEGHRVRVVADSRGGAYVGSAEAKANGQTAMLLLHYSGSGELLWSYHAPERTKFHDMALSSEDSVVLCGEQSRPEAGARGGTSERLDGVLIGVRFTGAEQWRVFLSATESNIGNDSARRIVRDSDGDLIVGGVGETSVPGANPSQEAFWVARVSSQGGILWKRAFMQSGRTLTLNALAVSSRSIYLGGVAMTPDYAERMTTLAYDKMGTPRWAFAVTRPQDSRSTSVNVIGLWQEEPIFAGSIATPIVDGKATEKEDVLLQAIRADGRPKWQLLYDRRPESNDALAAFCLSHARDGRSAFYAVGQTNKGGDKPHIILLKYQ